MSIGTVKNELLNLIKNHFFIYYQGLQKLIILEELKPVRNLLLLVELQRSFIQNVNLLMGVIQLKLDILWYIVLR